MAVPVAEIQAYLTEHELDAWVLADFHGRNGIAMSLLGIHGTVTRRSFFVIPAVGDPVALVHRLEVTKYAHLGWRTITFSQYSDLERELAGLLRGNERVAMEYSRLGRLPYIGLVDSGTIDLVKELGPEVVSSADLVAWFGARLTPEGIALHRIAAHNLLEIKNAAFDFIRTSLRGNQRVTEYDVCRFILEKFDTYEMETDHGPNCSIDAHAGDPHYDPPREGSWEIKPGSLVLLDLWAKLRRPDAVYADITWMGYTASATEIPGLMQERFGVIAAARDSGIAYLRERIEREPVHGSQVDDVVRKRISDAGYGDQFIHRTGHSLTHEVHGVGPNIDNGETEETRRLQRGHLFTVEPGIYFADSGFRTEINVFIGHEGAEVTTLPLQTTITPLV